MKKNKILLPLVGFATLSSVVTPLVTLASCSYEEGEDAKVLEIICPDKVEVGQAIQCHTKDEENTTWNIDKSSSGIAKMTENGILTGLKLGKVKIIATLINKEGGKTICGTKEVSIVAPQTEIVPKALLNIENGVLKGFVSTDADLSAFTTFTIPAEVKVIAPNAFWDGEKSTLPENIVNLDYERKFKSYPDKGVTVEVFSNCSLIGDEAFYGSHLKTVVLPFGVREIGKRAFALSRNLTDCYFPAYLNKIGTEAFLSTGLTAVAFNDMRIGQDPEGKWDAFPAADGKLSPETGALYGLPSTWWYGPLIQESCVNYIGDKAFYDCPNLVYHKPTPIKDAYSAEETGEPYSLENNIFSNYKRSEEYPDSPFTLGEPAIKILDLSHLRMCKQDVEGGLIEYPSSPNYYGMPAADEVAEYPDELGGKTIIFSSLIQSFISTWDESQARDCYNQLSWFFGGPQAEAPLSNWVDAIYYGPYQEEEPVINLSNPIIANFAFEGEDLSKPQQKPFEITVSADDVTEIMTKPFQYTYRSNDGTTLLFPEDVEITLDSIKWNKDEGIKLSAEMDSENRVINFSWDKAPSDGNFVEFELIMKSKAWGLERKFGVQKDQHHTNEGDPQKGLFDFNDPFKISFDYQE